MRDLVKLLAFVFLLVTVSGEDEKSDNDVKETDHSHGFGEDINWVKWSDAKDLAQEQHKPIFLLIHKSWCGACQSLKMTFRASTKRAEFVELSKKFVMVNTEDDDEPQEEHYAPDGQYIPRIFFLDDDGMPFENINNAASYPRNTHYFPQIPNIIKAMNKAVDAYASPTKGKEDASSEGKQAEKEEKQEIEDDEYGSCPHAAKARAMKKEQEAREKAEKMEKKAKKTSEKSSEEEENEEKEGENEENEEENEEEEEKSKKSEKTEL